MSAIDLVKAVAEEEENVDVTHIGEPDFVITFEDPKGKNAAVSILKTIFVSLVDVYKRQGPMGPGQPLGPGQPRGPVGPVGPGLPQQVEWQQLSFPQKGLAHSETSDGCSGSGSWQLQ